MPWFNFKPPQPESEVLVAPPTPRLSTPSGERLATILESNPDGDDVPSVPQTPTRHQHARHSAHSGVSGRSNTATLPRVSSEPMPPPYSAYPQSRRPNEARLFAEKDAERSGFRRGRGGWGRFALIAGIILVILAIALGVGLGVGLKKKPNSAHSNGAGQSNQSNVVQAFPLGQYSYTTSLRNISTSCTSNSATWRCPPYATFQGSDSPAGMATFNWALIQSAPTFATNSSARTDSSGIPANVSVSSGMNPFSLILDNIPLTFINDNNNPRYTFYITNTTNVAPSTNLTESNVRSICFFNQTMIRASLYLSNSVAKDYPGQALVSSGQAQGGYSAWPYAIDISETAAGGQNVPNCYEENNGIVGARIEGFTVQPSAQQCSCDYRNFS